jgi:hypothetical protein
MSLKTDWAIMVSYRLASRAKEDLFRIYEYGMSKFGGNHADAYY